MCVRLIGNKIEAAAAAAAPIHVMYLSLSLAHPPSLMIGVCMCVSGCCCK